MRGINIPIEFELTPRSRALMEAIAKALPPERVGEAEGELTVRTSAPSSTQLKIGEHSEAAGGVYAGVSRGENGEPDAHLFLLDDKPDGKLNWSDARAWADKLSHGARLPTRFESALLYANLQDQLDTESWHWTGTQSSDNSAWLQFFDNGYQFTINKSYEAQCRAVRRLVL